MDLAPSRAESPIFRSFEPEFGFVHKAPLNQGFNASSGAASAHRPDWQLNCNSFSTDERLRHCVSSFCGGVFRGGGRGLPVPGRDQFRLYFGPLCWIHGGFFAVGRKIVNRKVAACLLRTRRRVCGRTDQRQIGDRTRAASQRNG